MVELILVDEQDNIVGTAEKMLVHQSGMLHRAFSIFVFRKKDNNIQLLLQKRQINKYHSGGLWTNSCCGHPGLNQEIISSAGSRLQEELGINIKLYYLDRFIYNEKIKNNNYNTLIEHELDHVFVGIYQEDDVMFDHNEVDEIKWIDINTFELELLNFPENFTVWVGLAWDIVKKNLLFINNLL